MGGFIGVIIFPSSAFVSVPLEVVFDMQFVHWAEQKEYEKDKSCYEGDCNWGDWYYDNTSKSQSDTALYHTDTLFLTRWTNGFYNNQNDTNDYHIDSLSIHSGGWGGF